MRKSIIAAAAATTVLGLSGCGAASHSWATTPEGMCGYLVGNGAQGGGGTERGNRTVNKIVYPGQGVEYNEGYDMVRYFPCGPRNYNVSPTSGDQAAGGQVLLQARTKDNTPVFVDLMVWWMPNLKEAALRQFITLCQKYECSNDNLDTSSGGNFSSNGWNGLLNENFHFTLEQLVKRNTNLVGDDVWLKEDMGLRDQLAGAISDGWNAEFQKVSGATEDLVCGSVNTGSAENFDCQHIRVQVTRVYPVNQDLADSNSKAIAQKREAEIKAQQANDRKGAAIAVYGPELADLALFCEDHPSATCVVGAPTNVQVNRP
jgi:hypothetical protein